MSEERQAEHDPDPDPIKHSDAERVTSEEAERVPPSREAEPGRAEGEPSDPESR